MGRLFWKFFTFLWLAQAATFICVGLLIWMWPPPLLETPLPHPVSTLFSPDGGVSAASIAQRTKMLPPLPLLAGLMVSLAFAAWLSWYFSRPIRNLNRAFEALAGGRLDTRIGAAMGTRRDELADLGQAFDRSAAKLQTLVEAQQRLLHDVSHELRSPLARLQACSDLLVQQPSRSIEMVDRILRETGRMDKLVGELLTLARLDAETTSTTRDVVDLMEVVHTLHEDARLELESKACRFEVESPDEVLLRGDSELLYRALDNVLRNAIRFSPYGGKISVLIEPDAPSRQVRVTISDQGPGVDGDDLQAIFEPFYRKATDARKDAVGYGLGLTIARSIVHSHGGNIAAFNRKEGGLEMRVMLPFFNPQIT